MGISGDAGNKRKRKNVNFGNEETDFNSDTDVICSSQPLISCKNKRNTEAEHDKKTKKFKKSSVHNEPEEIVTGSSSSTSENNNFKIPPAECEVRKKRKKNKHLTSENGEAVRNSDTEVIGTSQKLISSCENLTKLKNITETDVLQEKPLKKKLRKACVENEPQDILIESSTPHEIKNNKLKSWSSEIENCEALADSDQVQKKRKKNKHKTTKNEEIVLNSDAEVISASQTQDSCNENRHEFENHDESEVKQEKRIKKKSVKVKIENDEEEITTESSDTLNIEDNNSQSCFSETENCRALTDDHHVQKRRKKNKHKKIKNEEIDLNSDTEVISASQTLDSCNENRDKFENYDETEIKQEKRIKKKSVKVKLENEEGEITTESSDTLNIEDNNSKNDFSETENCEALTDDNQVKKKRKKNKHKTTKNEDINFYSDTEVISASQTLDSHEKNTHRSEIDRQEKPIKKKSEKFKLENEEEMTTESSSEIENCQSSTDGHHAQKRRKKNKHKTTNEFENICAINQEQETVEKKSKKRFKQDYEPDTDIKLEKNTAVEDAEKKKEKNKDDNTDKKSTKHNISDHKMSKESDADWNSSVDDAANVSCKSENMLDTAVTKKKVIQLLKETTSVNRLKDELNLELDDVTLEKLGRLRVEIPWDIPLIHKLAPAASVAPTSDQRKALEDANIKIKLGKFTKEEDKKIEANWKLFCKYHDWDEANYVPFLKNSKQSKHGYLPRGSFRKFVQFISHNFLDRFMYNIYARFQRIFSKNLVDSQLFTPEEDEIIMQYKDKSNATKPFADLAVLLNRPRLAVLKRYKRIQEEKSFEKKTIIWNYELTKELLLKILEVTGAKSLASLKERHLAAGEWDRISEAMGIPVAKLKRFWLMDLYTRVFNPKYDENLDAVRMELVKTLKENYNDWREVDWQELSNKFDSYTSQRLYKIFMDLVKTKVPRSEQKDFKACFEYLKEFPQSRKRFLFVQDIVKELEMKNGIDSVQTETKCIQ